MTQNQIRWQEHVEQSRHNRELERLTASQNAETQRANLARESENTRTNLANEGIKREANVINDTHYLRQDYENARSNRANETLKHETNMVQLIGHQLNYQLGQDVLLENARHNVVSEGQQDVKLSNDLSKIEYEHEDRRYSNETNRLDQISRDKLNYSQQDLNYQKLKESKAEQALRERQSELITSQKFRNYAAGFNDIVRGTVSVVDIVDYFKGGSGNEQSGTATTGSASSGARRSQEKVQQGKEKSWEEQFWERIASQPVDEEGFYVQD